MSVLSTFALMPYVSRLTPLVHYEHMDRWWKHLILDVPCLKDEIQARGRNVVKDMLGNNLLQVRIGCIRILLEQRADLTVIGCEQGNGIVRLTPCLVIVGMDMLRHGRCSFYLSMCSGKVPHWYHC